VTDRRHHRPHGHHGPHDEDVVFLDDSAGDDVSRAFDDAVRAVTAVEERHRQGAAGTVFPTHGKGEGAAAGRAAPEPVAPPAEVPVEPEPSAEGRTSRLELEAALEAQRDRAEKAEEEIRQLRESLLRKSADLENVKRRTEKEKADHYRFALAEAFRDLLGVLDNFERALSHAPDDIRSGDFGVGVEMIARQLDDVLRRYGLAEIPADKLPFDPNVHEAVAREETASAPPGTVVAVFQKGYTLNDRLLRPAMVKVSALPGRPSPEGGQ
jgi:molecular chaperone GrpE